MELELIRPVVRIGNSSGIVLPKSWLNHHVKVEIVKRKKSEILEEILKILKDKMPLSAILGIYLTGSYARNEETLNSDIDILVITENVNKSIKKGKYEILVISKRNMLDSLEKNALPLIPMIRESKPLLNESLVKELLTIPLTKKNLNWHVTTTDFAIKENEYLIEITKKLKEILVNDAIAYSLVLRLRGIYIIDCLIKNKLWNNKEFLKIIKYLSGSTLGYERYLYVKNEKGENKNKFPLIEAEKLLIYIKKQNKNQKKWLKNLKD